MTIFHSLQAMDLNQLKTFYILAQTRNYSNCARRLYVTQSAVSHAIKKLENSIGRKLIEKKGSEFQLTREGNLLYASCKKIFTELEAAEHTINADEKAIETIRLGSPIEFGVSILIKSMNDFFRSHPRTHVDFYLGNYLFQDLMDEKLDILIDCKQHQHHDVKTINLFREEYVVIASPEYLSRHSVETLEDLEGCNILSLDKEMTWWDNFIHALPLESTLQFTQITAINHVRGMINAVIASMGIGFVPKYTVLKELEDNSVEILFPSLALLEDVFRIYVKVNKAGSEKYNALIRFLKKLKLV